MSERTRARLAWLLAGAGIALLAGSLVTKATFGLVWGAGDSALLLPGMLGVLSFAILGALITSRTGNAIGWIFLAIAVLFGVSTNAQNWYEAPAGQSLPFPDWMNWLSGWPFYLCLGLLIAVFFLFPTGRVPSSRWRWPWRAYVASLTVTVVGFAVQPYVQRRNGRTYANPIGIEAAEPILAVVLAIAGTVLGRGERTGFRNDRDRPGAGDRGGGPMTLHAATSISRGASELEQPVTLQAAVDRRARRDRINREPSELAAR